MVSLILVVHHQLEILLARPKPLICLVLVHCAIGGFLADAHASFREWLGPQTNENATLFAPVVVKPIDPAKHDRLSHYQIDLAIVRGRDLKLPASDNAIVTFTGKRFQQSKEFRADEKAMYLVGKMQLKRDRVGRRFYTLNARVTKGQLKGAVVHLRDGKIQDSITDPCIAIYRIPDDIEVKTGKVPFEIVALFAK